MKWLFTKICHIAEYWQTAGGLAVLRRIYVRLQGPRWQVYWKKGRIYQKINPICQQWIYHQWKHYISYPEQQEWKTEINSWHYHPEINIFLLGSEANMPLHILYNSLERSLTSIQKQTYPHWNLQLLVESFHTAASLFSWIPNLKTDPGNHIRYELIPQGISFTSKLNQMITKRDGEWVIILFAGDQLAAHALHEVVCLLQNHEADLIYTDHDHFNHHQTYLSPCFKPNWSPWYFLTHNYIQNLCVFRHDLVQKTGGIDPQSSVPLYDLILRISEQTSANRILHIPQVLYHHWADKSPNSLANQWYGLRQEKGTLEQIQNTLQRRKINAIVTYNAQTHTTTLFPTLKTTPLVSIIIPFRDQFAILHKAIASILKKTTYQHFEILLVDNQSQASTRQQVTHLVDKHPQLKVMDYPHDFNYSAINNIAASRANGDFLVLLNNDIEVITPKWLEWMLAYAQYPQHGAIGAKLYYPNGLLQHAGVTTGIFGVAGHTHRFAHKTDQGYSLCLENTHEVSAVTAACLMVRRELYHQVDGMDAEYLRVAFNDVDFCLRLQQNGYSNIFLPTVKMIHHESLSRGQDTTPDQQKRVHQEIETMQKRWGSRLHHDPFYNRNLALDAEDLFFRFPPLSLKELRIP
ncbi:MAG: glycosyltransferase family 2 protein [SAR324 cluster bacterium]|nr:glycosyltransferase family 2 protein [SAR324 cluster bacterium]